MVPQLQRYAELGEFNRRLRWVLVVVLAIVVGGFEALGAVLIYVLLGMITEVEDALVVPVLGDMEAFLPDRGDHTLMLTTAAVLVLFFIARALVVLSKTYVEMRVVENAGARLSRRLARGYLSMPYAFHLRRNSSELIRNCYFTVDNIAHGVFRPLVKIVSEGLLALGLLAVLLATAPLATALIVVLLGPAAFVLLRLVHPRLKALGRDSQTLSRASLQSLQQSLGSARDIKVLGRERFFEQEFGRLRQRFARVRYIHAVLGALPAVALETVMVLFIAGFFVITVLVAGAAAAAIPVLGLFAYAALRLKPAMTVMVAAVNTLRFSSAGVEDVYNDLMLLERNGHEWGASDSQPLPFDREIHVDDVTFRYDGAEIDALVGVDLRIRQGESVGIVGPTGGGKTTLVDIILGLLQPTTGSLRVDGLDIRGCTEAWQRNLGMVPQTLFLADDTLRRNIAYGLASADIDEALVAEAVRLAQLETVVAALPDGLDTVVGERGVRLSGGQRQRVAIARALYRNPKVIVFDEATSALDNVTEAELLRALEELRSARTLIVVAHRLTTVRSCDQIFYLTGGRIVDVGTYEELRARSAAFREFTLER